MHKYNVGDKLICTKTTLQDDIGDSIYIYNISTQFFYVKNKENKMFYRIVEYLDRKFELVSERRKRIIEEII